MYHPNRRNINKEEKIDVKKKS